MKLHKIVIESYKNLNGTYSFENNNGYIALIGLNGSGKSNLLEAISIIFDKLIKGNDADIPFNYEIEYEINGHLYSRKKREAKKDGEKCNVNEIEFPASVIACYSGEDLRLWNNAFEDYYMHYFNQAVKNRTFSPRLNYINKYCWKIAFVALFCSEKASVKEFLNQCLHIKELTSINCHFTIDADKKEKFTEHLALKWFNRIETLQNESADKMINANTIRTIDMSMYGVTNTLKYSQRIFQFLYLLSMPEKDTEKGQTIDKLITDIKIDIAGVNFDGLSEGEKKMILIECITQILGDNNSLILLDEPDAHIHIALKKEILNCVEIFEGQTLLTSHSPIFVNEIYNRRKDNLFFMEKGNLVKTDYINNLILLSSGEIDFLSGSILLSSKKILVTEGAYDKRYLEKAIECLKTNNPYYEIFEQIVVIPSGSASHTNSFYEQVLKPQIGKYDKIVFLFDYDNDGYKGWQNVRKLHEEKLNSIFYQTDYNVELTQQPNLSDTIMVEDLFEPESYKAEVESAKLGQKKTHKDFRCFHKKMESSIKTYIEKNYSSFNAEWFNGFKPVLDKLIEVFDLK